MCSPRSGLFCVIGADNQSSAISNPISEPRPRMPRLQRVAGGDVVQTGLTPTVLVLSAKDLADGITVPLGTHAHANWAFGAEATDT